MNRSGGTRSLVKACGHSAVVAWALAIAFSSGKARNSAGTIASQSVYAQVEELPERNAPRFDVANGVLDRPVFHTIKQLCRLGRKTRRAPCESLTPKYVYRRNYFKKIEILP